MSLDMGPPVAFLAIAVAALGVLWDGGYSPASRVVFGALAVVAGLALGRWRSPAIALLVALSALGALSALWTLGPVDRTLRWSLVTLGYAAGAALASPAARRRGGGGGSRARRGRRWPRRRHGGVAGLGFSPSAWGWWRARRALPGWPRRSRSLSRGRCGSRASGGRAGRSSTRRRWRCCRCRRCRCSCGRWR